MRDEKEVNHFIETLAEERKKKWNSYLVSLRDSVALSEIKTSYSLMTGTYIVFLYIYNYDLNKRTIVEATLDEWRMPHVYLGEFEYFRELGKMYDDKVKEAIDLFVRQLGRSRPESKALGIRRYKEVSRNNRTQTRKFKPRKGHVK
ncbi:hypothetical protein [Enterococcus phage vB_EfaH_149]|uniref:Uncharacterized protein n=1 Tax=Enterococcus phage vB_EfaH_149 TaxID=2730535 RepID=A0ACA9ATH6_9CAUD|nr:hypothetical protein [Enterococcus phage vB_EfaH_149]